MSEITVVSFAERPELETRGDDLAEQWAQFMFHDPLPPTYYPPMFQHYGAFQLYHVNAADDTVAQTNAIPLAWDGTPDDLPAGWEAALVRGVEGYQQGVTPNTLCALVATVSPRFIGQGFGTRAVQGMRDLAAQHGYKALIAPVRPSLKAKYPLTPMERYITWTREDGKPFDPWMRIHATLGAEILKVAPESMTIPGTVAQWEEWTAMRFPDSGQYVVPGALAPITIDRAADRGVYVEPNVWMVHRLA
jgi:GNAT superfamily N-acetyltransferase